MYNIIAMEREFASGGNEIGRRVAKQLGMELYDRNILVEAARRLEIPAIYIEELEETAPGSIIFNLSKTAIGGNRKENANLPLSERLFLEEKKIIEELVEKQNCVFVGRCASYILKERTDCLKVFVYADKEYRLHRAVHEEGHSSNEVEAFLRRSDRRRGSFFNAHTSWKWRDMDHFDLCLDSGSLGIDRCVDILTGIMKNS